MDIKTGIETFIDSLMTEAKLNRREKAKAGTWFKGIKPQDQSNVVQLICAYLKSPVNPVRRVAPDTPFIDVEKAIEKYDLNSDIPNFGVYAVGSTVKDKTGKYNDIDLIWADPRFGLISDFSQYIFDKDIPIVAKRFKIDYFEHNLAEAFVLNLSGTKAKARIHVCIPKCYETLHWMGAVQKFPDFLTPRQYEATKEFKEAKAVVLYRSK